MVQYRISFIGAGKVSKALMRALYNSGHIIREIMSRSGINSRILSEMYNAIPKEDYTFSGEADIIIVAIPDDELAGVLGEIECSENVIVVHTAGSLGLEIFPPSLNHQGVFYPLQTFSDDRAIDLKNVPFFIEASDQYTAGVLTNLAGSIGGKVRFITTGTRKLLHVAAVFVSNFTNYMLTSGNRIMIEAGLDFEYLEPLVKETIFKALEKGPEDSQTGPAVRLDMGTIERHTSLLSFSPELQSLYTHITQSIINYYNTRK